MRYHLASLFCVGLLTGVASAQPAVTTLAVYPPEVKLFTSRARASFAVQATYADGLTRDVTSQAGLRLSNAAVCKLDKNQLTPLADGVADLVVEFGGRAVAVPVTVKDAKVDRPISFKLDVMPVFMRAGCNVGGCHGAARGKDGFRLSLFGFDPDGDYQRLTRELSGRRINLAIPEESLIIQKALGRVPHTGGKRFEAGCEMYQTLMRWLNASAPADPGEVPKVVSVEIYPKNGVLDGKGATQK